MVDKNKSVADVTPELTADEKALNEFFSDPKYSSQASKMRGIIKHVLGEIASEEAGEPPTSSGNVFDDIFMGLFKSK